MIESKYHNYKLFIKWKTQILKHKIKRIPFIILHRINSILVTHKNITIISEDCVGGAIYQFLGKPYQSPTVGLWISSADYLNFLALLTELHNKELIFENNPKYNYPIANLNGVIIGFQHYKSAEEALEKWNKRTKRIDFANIYYKIDFRYPNYTKNDIEKWNSMKLPKSLAIVNKQLINKYDHIHNSISLNSTQEYNNTRRELLTKFVYWKWINSGIIKFPNFYESAILKLTKALYN